MVEKLQKLVAGAVAALSLACGGCSTRAAIKAAGSSQQSSSSPRPSAAASPPPQALDNSAHPAPMPDRAATVETSPTSPTREVTHEPWLARELDLNGPLLPFFTSTTSLRRDHLLAQRTVDAARAKLRSNEWSVDIRTGCLARPGDRVGVAGRAVVRDRNDRVRVFSEAWGSDDSAGTSRLYYDDALRLKVVIFKWRSVSGQAADGVMVLDGAGHLERCTSLPNDAGAIFCGEPKSSTLDPEVEAATRGHDRTSDAADAANETVSWVTGIAPAAELSECETPYRGQQK